ncbi:MAG: hypothetical protein IJT87_09100, partial [Ruminiclostridium sp.]|nr:hypothetical protein [Ruminiclostridium sp.]
MSDIRTKQERLIDAIGDTSDKNVAIAVGAASESRELKREVKRIEVITPEIPGKKAVKRSVLTRVISLAAAAVLLTVGTCYLFGILRIQDRIRPYKPAYEASEHSPTWKSAKEATGMEWTQLTEAEKTFDSSAVKTDASAKLREYNVHALWYKYDGKTLILRYDVEYTGWWSISPDMAGFGQLPSIWTFSFRKQADAMNADNYDQDAFRGAVTDVIGIDRSIWECACKIEFDEPRDRTELYAIKSYEGVNNYDDPYLLTAQKTAEYIIHTDVEMPDDPLMYYTDNNMPEPFEPADPDRPLTYSDADLHDKFTDLWQRKFRTLENIVPYLENTEKVDELYETYRAEQQYDRQAGNVTRYRIDDTVNLYRFMKDLGMSGEEMEAAITKMDEENRPLVDEGNLSYDVLFDLYTGIFGWENKEDMALTFKSNYSIAVGEYVFSPRWMYYHTIDDYNKVGITATQVGLMLERYRELGLTDEAWTAFFKKLNGYITYYKKTTETRIYPVRDEDCYGMTFSEALDILEQHFYGSWKRKPALDGEYGTVTFTYSQDIFDHAGFHRPLRMGETDDIWYMECMSSGESEVWVIEKSDPTVMYCTGLVYYNGYDGRPALNLDAEWVTKYEYEETLTVNELRSGKISVLGMDKLLSIYGDDFISFYYEVIEGGYMSDYGDYYVVGNDMMTAGPDMYLVGRSDDSVTLGIRYFKEDEYRNYLNDAGEEPTEYYFAVTFTL